jgi:hypothetical protein
MTPLYLLSLNTLYVLSPLLSSLLLSSPLLASPHAVALLNDTPQLSSARARVVTYSVTYCGLARWHCSVDCRVALACATRTSSPTEPEERTASLSSAHLHER